MFKARAVRVIASASVGVQELAMHTIVDGDRGFSFGEAIYPAGGTYGPLKDRYVLLLTIHEGSARVSCDGNETTLGTRSCGFFPLQRLAIELGSGSSSTKNALRNALGQAIFLAYFHEAHISDEERLIPRSVMRARFYIDENYGKEITVGRLAELVGVTRQHLATSFRKHVGSSPERYLWNVRASHGRVMLIQTQLPVADIAYRCGYKNPFHFSRQISEQFGMSPSELRANKGCRLPSAISESAANSSYIMQIAEVDSVHSD